MGAIGTLGAFDPAGAAVESEAGNLTTPGPIDLQATLARLVDRDARGVAMEVSSHSLDQGRIEGLIFRAAIFTNLTRDHLDYHETFEAYFGAKAKLIGYLAENGLAVINADDRRGHGCRARRAGSRSPRDARADVTARDVQVDAKGARFTLVTTRGSFPVALPLLGRFNVANALGRGGLCGGTGRAAQSRRGPSLHVAAGPGPDGAHRRGPLRRAARLRPHNPMPWNGRWRRYGKSRLPPDASSWSSAPAGTATVASELPWRRSPCAWPTSRL